MPERVLSPGPGTDATLARLAIDHKGTGLLAGILFRDGIHLATDQGVIYIERQDDIFQLVAPILWDQQDWRPRLRAALRLLLTAGLLTEHPEVGALAYPAEWWNRHVSRVHRDRRRQPGDPIPPRPRRGRPPGAIIRARISDNPRANYEGRENPIVPGGFPDPSPGVRTDGKIARGFPIIRARIIEEPETPMVTGEIDALARAGAPGRDNPQGTLRVSLSPPPIIPPHPSPGETEPTPLAQPDQPVDSLHTNGISRKETIVRWDMAGWCRVAAMHPRMGNETRAKRAWEVLRPSPELVEEICSDIGWRLANPDHPDGWRTSATMFIPTLPHYLADRRWTDQRAVVPPPTEVTTDERPTPPPGRPLPHRRGRLTPADDDTLDRLAAYAGQ